MPPETSGSLPRPAAETSGTAQTSGSQARPPTRQHPNPDSPSASINATRHIRVHDRRRNLGNVHDGPSGTSTDGASKSRPPSASRSMPPDNIRVHDRRRNPGTSTTALRQCPPTAHPNPDHQWYPDQCHLTIRVHDRRRNPGTSTTASRHVHGRRPDPARHRRPDPAPPSLSRSRPPARRRSRSHRPLDPEVGASTTEPGR